MKLLILAVLVAAVAALQRESDFMTILPESWYEEEANKAAADDPDTFNMPFFMNADESMSADFGASNFGDPKNVLDVAQQLGATIFVHAAYYTKTADTFKNTQSITAFIPSNAAFARLPKNIYFYFLRHPDRLAALLKYHVAQGVFMIKDLVNDQTYKTLEKDWTLRYDAYNHTSINYTSRIIQTARISHRHVDQAASNGVVHIIDEVILGIPFFSAYDVISKSTHFSTLYNGLIVAGLDQSLKSAGPLTLFAPTEEAFKRLPPGVWEALLKDKTALTNVLDLHLANRTYFARGFRDMDVLPTLNKANSLTVHIRRHRGDEDVQRGPSRPEVEVEVNDAKIIFFDGVVTNGIIQVVDTVLLPPKIKEQYNLL
ncbi:periostin-like [Paramacrobiotus metropolitanus]|uniref:periostin-like n=1 Tax=Paramacrobiotus metropolitanus TaxID=2943436 RepID=UPI0024462192|nr:periostin-like [Paramacrobiotus metropolitanus]